MPCTNPREKARVLETLKKLVPVSVRQYRNERREKAEFARLATLKCDATRLRNVRDLDLAALFADATLAKEWQEIEREISKLRITDKAAGVNLGDRRALYYLIRHLKPKTVLEIGTHVGASTVHIVAALRKQPGIGSFRVDTVDIYDVNDPVVGPWATMHSTYPPAELMRALGCAPAVTFHAKDSLDYMSACTLKFDLIFLRARSSRCHLPAGRLRAHRHRGVLREETRLPNAVARCSDLGRHTPGAGLVTSAPHCRA
jgi:hypothetical protein